MAAQINGENDLKNPPDTPSWMLNSEFVLQFAQDFPGEPLQLDGDRLFEFPPQLDTTNITAVLDTVRYLGINNFNVLKIIYAYLIESADAMAEQLKSDFPELLMVWYPFWIKNSPYFKQFEKDFPYEFCPLDSVRLFEFPAVLKNDNIALVLDNIRFLSINDDALLQLVFEYLVATIGQEDSEVSALMHDYPELTAIWENVNYARKHEFDESSCCCAAGYGLLYYLRYAHKLGCPFKKGYFEPSFFLSEGEWGETVKIRYDVCTLAARYGHLDCLKYAHEKGAPWVPMTCQLAALEGQLDCLKYTHENGCEWNYLTCSNACLGLSMECLRYAHDHGCPWDEHATLSAMHVARTLGRMEFVLYAVEKGYLNLPNLPAEHDEHHNQPQEEEHGSAPQQD